MCTVQIGYTHAFKLILHERYPLSAPSSSDDKPATGAAWSCVGTNVLLLKESTHLNSVKYSDDPCNKKISTNTFKQYLSLN